MKTVNNKTIRFSMSTDTKLSKLSLKLGRDKLEVFNQMVDYFYRTGKDPKDFNDELLKKALAKNHDSYISFTRVQEKDLLIPMHEDMRTLCDQQNMIITFFKDTQKPFNAQQHANFEVLKNKLDVAGKFIERTYNSQQQKEKLKQKFMTILDNYIRLREAIPLRVFKGAEKEELIAETKQQIIQL